MVGLFECQSHSRGIHLNLADIWQFRLLLAGLYPVEFRDFFLGDMYCSQTYSVGVSSRLPGAWICC